MSEKDAVDETRQLIRQGHAAILQVVRYSDDSAGDAFAKFRKGVVRADSSHQSTVLQELDQKPKVLMFLAEFAKCRRPHRRQIANVASILLKDSAWREASEGCGFLAMLPDEVEFHSEEAAHGRPAGPAGLAGPVPQSSGRAVAPEASEALLSVQGAISVLRRLDFERMPEEGQHEATRSLQQMAQGLHLVQQYHPEELQAVSRLEPKLSILRFLLLAYERLSREQALQVLRLLLQTQELASWRHAANSDHELLEALEALRVCLLDNDQSPISPNSRSDYESAEEELHGTAENHARWMWQDAGRGYGGPIGAGLARLNPARWSQLLPEERVIDDLCQFLGTTSEDRPVRLEVEVDGRRRKIEVANVREAVRKLQEHSYT